MIHRFQRVDRSLAARRARLGGGLALAGFALAAGCATARRPAAGPMEAGQGGVWIYLNPLADDAARLEFTLESIAALAADGAVVPLELRLSTIGREVDRERLLAAGTLPPGSYRALELGVSAAAVGGGDGRADLLVPDGPLRVDAEFTVRRRSGTVLSLELRYRDPAGAGFEFRPALAAAVPAPPAVDLIGLVSSREAHTVSMFNKLSGRVFAVVPTGREPGGIALDRLRRLAYVAISGEDAVEVIDLQQRIVVERLQLGSGDAPEELVLTRDGRALISVNRGSGTVSFIDVGGPVEVDRVAVGNGPGSLLLDPLRERLYVFNTLADTITVVDLTRRETVATLATDAQPLRGAFNREGDRLYVIHRSSPYFTVIDPATLSTVNRVYTGTGATALTVDPRTDRIQLARIASGTVDVYDPLTLLPVDFFGVEGDVEHMVIDRENNDLHLAIRRDDTVRVTRLGNQRERAAIDVGSGPFRIALMGER
jgi:DNA-binding beta-propeller fold protein YncE